jgi:hypothetical protein
MYVKDIPRDRAFEETALLATGPRRDTLVVRLLLAAQRCWC